MTIKTILTLIIVGSTIACSQKDQSGKQAEGSSETPGLFDAQLASELNADEYGMKQYVFVFLKAGPERSQDSLKTAQIQKAHLDNLTTLSRQGKLVLAGPFLDGGDLRGILILNVENLQEAERITAMDPAVQAGRLVMELHPWYGTASLQKIMEIHETIANK